jgi:lipid-binding SYLF domain-containing protein
MRRLTKALPAVLIAGLLAAPVILGAQGDEGYKSSQAAKSEKKDAKEAEKISAAEEVLKAAISDEDNGIPRDLLDKAKCIGVFPSFKKVALGIGGEGGKGLFTCRTDGGMSAPAFYKIGGGSVGWQAGVKEADLVLLVMTEEGMNRLLSDKAEIGTDISAAAGPAHDADDPDDDSDHHKSKEDMKAEDEIREGKDLLAWSRTHGAFAGASLDGLGLSQDEDDNQQLYKKPVQARDILTADKDELPVPRIAQSFVKTTERYM